jgi:hypothetical protein
MSPYLLYLLDEAEYSEAASSNKWHNLRIAIFQAINA